MNLYFEVKINAIGMTFTNCCLRNDKSAMHLKVNCYSRDSLDEKIAIAGHMTKQMTHDNGS